VWRWDSEPFGSSAANEDPDGDGVGFAYNLRFPGQYFDAETGFSYNWNRFYEPRAGRYTTSDPIGLDGGLNTYLYSDGTPLVFFDINGLCPASFDLGWRESKVSFDRRTPVPGKCQLSQTKWNLSGLLIGSDRECGCGRTILCEYAVTWRDYTRVMTADCGKRTGVGQWSDWGAYIEREWGVYAIPYDCETKELDARGSIKR
jgi:RHS repeat-associated protein